MNTHDDAFKLSASGGVTVRVYSLASFLASLKIALDRRLWYFLVLPMPSVVRALAPGAGLAPTAGLGLGSGETSVVPLVFVSRPLLAASGVAAAPLPLDRDSARVPLELTSVVPEPPALLEP